MTHLLAHSHYIVNYMTNPMDKIIEDLYLGSLHGITPEQLQKHRIHTVISLTSNAKGRNLGRVVQVHQCRPLLDTSSEQEKMNRIIKELLPIIHKTLSEGKRVLIHCDAGLHRAPTVVVHYLQYVGMTRDTAVKLVQARRPLALWRKPFKLDIDPALVRPSA